MRYLASLSLSITVTAFTIAASAKELPPIPTHSGWVTLEKMDAREGFKTFRRYGYLGDMDGPLPNLMIFNCAQDPSRTASHLTVILPKEFEPDSFSRSSWQPKIDVRMVINGLLSIRMPGEYRDGEFYFDLNDETAERFESVMLADSLSIGFGDKNDILHFQFTDRIDAFFAHLMKELKSDSFGQVRHFARAGVGGVEKACQEYQRTARRDDSPGPEAYLVVLFSTVTALQLECKSKANQRELDRLARLHNFTLADFSPRGRFSQEMSGQTARLRELVKQKGCGGLRSNVVRSFPKLLH